jgi:hypothetical protein
MLRVILFILKNIFLTFRLTELKLILTSIRVRQNFNTGKISVVFFRRTSSNPVGTTLPSLKLRSSQYKCKKRYSR